MPVKYLIPSDFEGIAMTVYSQEGFPELPVVAGYLVQEYPADGILITCSEPEFGAAADQTLDVLPDGTYRRLPGLHREERSDRFSATASISGGEGPALSFYYKIIGTEEYERSMGDGVVEARIDEAVLKLESTRISE